MNYKNQTLTLEQMLEIEQGYYFARIAHPSISSLTSPSRSLPVALLCALLNVTSPVPTLAHTSIDVTSVVMTTNSALQATTESEEFRRMVCRARKNTKLQKIIRHNVSELLSGCSLNDIDINDTPTITERIVEQNVQKARVRVRKSSVDTPSHISLASLALLDIDLEA